MDKPISMSVKDYIMRVMSIRENIPLKTIEAIVNNQFEEAHKALKDNYSIEISGFGKWIFNYKKAQKTQEKNFSKARVFTEKLNLPDLTELKRKSWQNKLDNTLQQIEQLKSKLKKDE
jgi:nucleoid DNA-binding protein